MGQRDQQLDRTKLAKSTKYELSKAQLMSSNTAEAQNTSHEMCWADRKNYQQLDLTKRSSD